ncbi:hypothetical protein [uncultured Paraglaciecola sp.]|uniref:hypothetical protein n=1 Tax=uncultured Paraglaciecola sp. TaxID=1765024 RepID=UPI0030D7A7B4|tara:strand:+ start:41514 stop:42443 length:930 start_codon:yes stop_codon:yes gene_type:complete
MKLSLNNITCALALTSSSLVWADNQSDFILNAELGAGLIHNSALSVDELDDVSSQSDSGHELYGSIKAKWQATDKAKLMASYAYNQKQYSEYSQYDLALHQISVDGSYQLQSSELGMRIDAASADLAGDTFLTYQQVSVYHGKFLQPETYLRSSIKHKVKSFTELPSRDASGVGANVDLFHFLNGANTMLLLGVNAEQENAEEQQFDYWAVGFNTKVTHKFDVFGLSSKVGLGLRYQKKDYQTFNLESQQDNENIERDENRKIVELNWQLHVLDNLSVNAQWQYGDYQSLISSQTYEQNITSVRLNYSF